jgi:hypothetical protein
MSSRACVVCVADAALLIMAVGTEPAPAVRSSLVSTPRATVDSAHKQRLTRLAFGSCSKQWLEQPLWTPILEFKPQLWLWTGDAIYGRSRGAAALSDGFATQLRQPDYRSLMSSAIIEGTWDDHDYGCNDAGKELPNQDDTQDLYLDFIGVRARSPRRRQRRGVYSSHAFGSPPQQVKVIMLDTRSFRDSYYIPSIGGSMLPFSPVLAALGRGLCAHCSIGSDYDGDILGETQWAWLNEQLKESPAAVHIIVSSVQVLTSNPLVSLSTYWGWTPPGRTLC